MLFTFEFKESLQKVTEGKGDDSLIKVRTDVRAQALGILGVNFCPGIRFWEVNFARALRFWQYLTKNV